MAQTIYSGELNTGTRSCEVRAPYPAVLVDKGVCHMTGFHSMEEALKAQSEDEAFGDFLAYEFHDGCWRPYGWVASTEPIEEPPVNVPSSEPSSGFVKLSSLDVPKVTAPVPVVETPVATPKPTPAPEPELQSEPTPAPVPDSASKNEGAKVLAPTVFNTEIVLPPGVRDEKSETDSVALNAESKNVVTDPKPAAEEGKSKEAGELFDASAAVKKASPTSKKPRKPRKRKS